VVAQAVSLLINLTSIGELKMSTNELEGLVSILRRLMNKAQQAGDTMEYFRLGEELRMADAALKSIKN
jgi:hypothetical protein